MWNSSKYTLIKTGNVQFSNTQNSLFVFLAHGLISNTCKLPEADVSDPSTGKKYILSQDLKLLLQTKTQQNKKQNCWFRSITDSNYVEAFIQAVNPTEQNHFHLPLKQRF